MALTSLSRIPLAQEFVRIGFGDAIDDNAAFYSHDFLTQELTTTEMKAVLPVLVQYNSFNGKKVADAISSFQGKVKGWKFGAANSPLLLVVLAPWTHQVEETNPRGKSGTKYSVEEREALVSQLRHLFLNELNADKFERDNHNKYVYGAWWD